MKLKCECVSTPFYCRGWSTRGCAINYKLMEFLLTKQRQELLLQCLQGELARTYHSVVFRVASVDIVGLLTN